MHEAEDDLFGDSNKMHLIVKVHSVKRKTSASDREATSLLQYCAVVRPFVEGEFFALRTHLVAQIARLLFQNHVEENKDHV